MFKYNINFRFQTSMKIGLRLLINEKEKDNNGSVGMKKRQMEKLNNQTVLRLTGTANHTTISHGRRFWNTKIQGCRDDDITNLCQGKGDDLTLTQIR